MPDTATADICPMCGHAVVRARTGPSWCPECEWNLGAYDRGETSTGIGWQRPDGFQQRINRRIDRFQHRVSFRINQRESDRLRSDPPAGARRSPALIALLAISAVTVLIPLALLAGSVLLVKIDAPLPIVLGAVLVMLAVFLRPRFPRFPGTEGSRIHRATHPVLFGLIDDVAGRIGAPIPEIVAVDGQFNAFCMRVGARRTRVLNLGLPLWTALDADGRMALLGYELGHLINGDPDSRLLAQPALTTYRRLAYLCNPRRVVTGGRRRNGYGERLGSELASVFMWPVYQLTTLLDLGVHLLAMRSVRRAEYLADVYACRAGGTSGAVNLFTVLVLAGPLRTAIRTAALSNADPGEWHEAGSRTVAQKGADIRLWEQRSIRVDSGVLHSHPPAGLRLRMARSWPRLGLDPADRDELMLTIDRELGLQYQRVARDLRG
ncbi:Zn-dependent protease with chaperone function [Nakamurella panacisegetis]|uniref:Zn-dependent protease with chaperone function n=1 Tax=Nakamurella panacisegetis TaxID=1090615 RepID=A0A1H0JGA9_9ACTN|nr:M48 family metalloprotease [Nakamurella panacisegetis]SDO42797.1 Zn-dependent protease with chaperone function [Nakamurella panacisegetis]